MKKLMYFMLSMVILVQAILPSAQVLGKEKESSVCNDCVVSIDYSKFDKEINEDELMQTVKSTLLNANKYALGGWFNDVKNLDEDMGKFYNLYKASKNSTVPEYIYRFPAAQSFGLAIALKTGAYDESIVGVKKEEAKEIAIKLAVSVAHEHKANTGVSSEPQYKPWGDDWQAAHWAYYAGYAGWLLWDDLTPEEQTLMRNMLIHEANRFVNQNALYWKTANGKEVYAGDSKIEEDSWNSELLNLAYHMLPQHENAQKWEYRMIEYQLASFATPRMNESDEIIHGKKAKDWVAGYNVNDDGSVINHGIIHPQYNAAATGVNTSIVNSVIGDDLPIAAKYNLDNLYKGISETEFDSPPFNAPGGTMYIDGSPDVYYPQGSDWGFGVYDTFANIDVSAYTYGYGKDAYNWAKLHAEKVLQQQNRHPDGHTYEGNENNYPGKEEAITMRMGNSYMTLWLKEKVGVNFTNKAVDYPHKELPAIEENQEYVFATDTAYVRGGSNANVSYYPSDIMEVKNDGGEEGSYSRESYLKFNMEGMKQIPTSVKLYIPTIEVGSQISSKNITNTLEYIQDNTWQEDSITFKTRPKKTGKELSTWTPDKEGVTLDITDYAKKSFVDDGKLSFRIFSKTSAGGETFARYGTARQADVNYRPRLLVSYSDDFQTAIKGNSEFSVGESKEVSFALQNAPNIKDHSLHISYDSQNFEVEDVYSDTYSLRDVNTSFAGKVTLKIGDKKSKSSQGDVVKVRLKALKETDESNVLKMILNNPASEVVSEATKELTTSSTDYSENVITLHQNRIETTQAIEDTFVREATSETHGKDVNLDCKAYANSTMTRQPFFKFDLPNKAELEEIDTIKLKFYVDANSNGGSKVYRFQYVPENTWSESTLTWATKPDSVKNIGPSADTLPGTHPNTLHEQAIKENGYIEFDVTNKVKELLNQDIKQMSLIVYGLKSDNTSVKIASKENEDVSKRPVLIKTLKQETTDILQMDVPNTIKRYETFDVALSGAHIKDVNDAVITIPYGKELKFLRAETDTQGIVINVLEDVPGKVVLQFKADEEFEDKDVLALTKLKFIAIKEGESDVSLQAATKDEAISNQKNIIVSNVDLKKPEITIDSPTEISKGDIFKVKVNLSNLDIHTAYTFLSNVNTNNIEVQDINAENIIFQPTTARTNGLHGITLKETDAVITYTLKALNNSNNAAFTFSITDENGSEVKEEKKLDFVKDVVNKDSLKELIAQCKKINTSLYTNTSVKVFKQALQKAETVYNDEFATEAMVNTAQRDLTSARKALRLNELNNKEAYRKELKTWIEQGEQIDNRYYTKESYAKLQSVILEGKRVYKNDATINGIKHAIMEIKAALSDLTLKPGVTDDEHNGSQDTTGKKDETDSINKDVKTGDISNTNACIAILFLSIAMMVISLRKKARNNEQ